MNLTKESKSDYKKTNETNSFYLRLHNSKWLRRISTVIALVSKIANCLHFGQRNVFLEELQSSKGNNFIRKSSYTNVCIIVKKSCIIIAKNIYIYS